MRLRRLGLAASLLTMLMVYPAAADTTTPPVEEEVQLVDSVTVDRTCTPSGLVCTDEFSLPGWTLSAVSDEIGVGGDPSDGETVVVKGGLLANWSIRIFPDTEHEQNVTIPLNFCPNDCTAPIDADGEAHGSAWLILRSDVGYECATGVTLHEDGPATFYQPASGESYPTPYAAVCGYQDSNQEPSEPFIDD